MATTQIEWTSQTWNPVTGCDKVSAGCKHCYAETLARRLEAMGNPRYRNGFRVTLHPDKIAEPAGWRKPTSVFVNSMSDLLHEAVPDAYILDVFETMAIRAPQHEYQVLTKRTERWGSISAQVVRRFGGWPPNILPGTSIEDARFLGRLDALALAGDELTIRMVSAEPLLGSLAPDGVPALAAHLRRARVGWVITGGEAGYEARPADMRWFVEIRDACALAAVPFFHKQHGGRGVTKRAKAGGDDALLEGRLHHERPVIRRPAQGRLL